ncbi:hypothetical protein ZIOFF_024762 [Zingiber officinale]|uniref:Uncharacterized protein n=1 Tax=Zingiber officinale TaxID=94328 RepID=A0A8J5GWU3_ZINOF|nr:hypothetical protein ZIOFF_024762 [Zingiber officinale]
MNDFGSQSTSEQVIDDIDASSHSVIIIIGKSGGIRAEIARVMALRGAHIIIRTRNLEATDAVKQHISQNNPSAKSNIIELELSSQKSMQGFANKFLATNLPLKML